MVNRYLDPYIGMLKIDLKDVLYYKADFLYSFESTKFSPGSYTL